MTEAWYASKVHASIWENIYLAFPYVGAGDPRNLVDACSEAILHKEAGQHVCDLVSGDRHIANAHARDGNLGRRCRCRRIGSALARVGAHCGLLRGKWCENTSGLVWHPMMIRFKMDPHAISTMHDGMQMPIASMITNVHHVVGEHFSPRTS